MGLAALTGRFRLRKVSEELRFGLQQPCPVHQGAGLRALPDPRAPHFVRGVVSALSGALGFTPAQEFRALPDCVALGRFGVGAAGEDFHHLSVTADLRLVMKVRFRCAHVCMNLATAVNMETLFKLVLENPGFFDASEIPCCLWGLLNVETDLPSPRDCDPAPDRERRAPYLGIVRDDLHRLRREFDLSS